MLKSNVHIPQAACRPRQNAGQAPSIWEPKSFIQRVSFRLAGMLFLICCVLVFPHAAASQPPPLNAKLDRILKRELPRDFAITIQAVDLGTGRVLFEHNPDLPLVPASTMKVVTSCAALKTLHPEFKFMTEVLADDVKGSSVGNIYLKGFGDPYLVSERLFTLTREVRNHGVGEIRGNIVVDDSYFIPGQPVDENEKIGYRSYHAPYSALSLNFNSLKIAINPGEKLGDPAEVMADPTSEYAQVKGEVTTVKGRQTPRPQVAKSLTKSGKEIIRVKGVIGVNADEKAVYVNVSNPSLYTGYVFKEFLLREGIKVTGKVVEGKVPSSATKLMEYESFPLAIIVYWLNKYSNNFMAEQLSLAMGAQMFGPPGTREKGLSAIRRHLLSLGVGEGSFVLSEGSGLSRKNRLSASALVHVLTAASQAFTYNAEFVASLGIAGVDGTLKEKFNDPSSVRRIRAKTGNLRGVNALAGFAISQDGRVYAFAAIVNSRKSGVGFIDYAERVIRAVLDLPMSGSLW